MPKIDAPEISAPVAKSNDKVYVSIPEKDIEDRKHPDIIVNSIKYAAGERHYVTPELAETIEGRIKAWHQNVSRLHQRTPDLKAFNANPENRGKYALFNDATAR